MLKSIKFKILVIFIFLPLFLKGEFSQEIEVRTAAFYPTDHLFRAVYGNWQAASEFEYTWHFTGHWSLWGGADYVWADGHSTGISYKTLLNLWTFDTGLKLRQYIHPASYVYLGLGPTLGIVHIHNCSPYVTRKQTRVGAGLIVKSGIKFFPREYNVFELFFDYCYQPMNFAQMSGLRIGIGIGIAF